MQVGALEAIGNGLADGIRSFAGNSGRAAANANAVSKTAQNTAANFNQGSANIANNINANTLAEQYGFNSGQASIANQFTEHMWDKASAWNETMFNRQLEFNAEQAQINRDWQEKMRATAYQTAVKDMELAGLNPILAATSGISAGNLSGGAASVSAPSMSGASGAMASGGLLGANDASISGYTGQMEYMGGMLGLLSSALGGISTAVQAWAAMGQNDHSGLNYDIADFVSDLVRGLKGDQSANDRLKDQKDNPNTNFNSKKRDIEYWLKDKDDDGNKRSIYDRIRNKW